MILSWKLKFFPEGIFSLILFFIIFIRTWRELNPQPSVPKTDALAQASPDLRRALSRPRGASRAVLRDRAGLRAKLHRRQLRQPDRQGHAPRPGPLPALCAPQQVRATMRRETVLSQHRPRDPAGHVVAQGARPRSTLADPTHPGQRRRRAQRAVRHGLLSRR